MQELALANPKCEFIDEADLQQGTSKWHEFRAEGFGASEANIIAGMSKWKTVVDLWAAKTGRPTEPFVMNDAVQHGIDTEPEARQRFIDATDLNMTPICAVSNRHTFVRASLDGISDDRRVILEIKCPSALGIHMATVKGKVPEYYYPQLQHQLYVTGAEVACFWSYVQSMGGFMIEVKPNLPYLAELIHREKLLWEHVINDTEPNPKDFPPLIP
jgi:putative phage-type endonuclease